LAKVKVRALGTEWVKAKGMELARAWAMVSVMA